MKFILALLTCLFIPTLSAAQSWPARDAVFVNDLAGVLSDAPEAWLAGELKQLQDEAGIEVSVLTLASRSPYAATAAPTDGSADGIAEFSTGLFNEWGIGGAEKNDGILVLLVIDDREIRVELGAGYGNGYNALAAAIIDRVFVPALKAGDYNRAMVDGTFATMEYIARPHATGAEAASAETTEIATTAPVSFADANGASGGGSKKGLYIMGGGFLALVLAVIFGKRASDRLRKCPSCGKRGIHTARKTLVEATETSKGRAEDTLTCPHCGHSETTTVTTPVKPKPAAGKSSGEGGASGKW